MYSELDQVQVASLKRLVTTCDVVLMGRMGAGKTTLISHMQRYVPLRYLAQGEITRSILEFQPAAPIVEADARPKPWGFELVLDILAPLMMLPEPYVLDGLPKHPHEAAWLVEHFKSRGRSVVILVVHANVSTVRSRLNAASRAHRADSIEEIDHRITTFNENFARNIEILTPVVARVIELDSVRYRPVDLVRQVADAFASEGR
jgi:adenylate kinase family enzyme